MNSISRVVLAALVVAMSVASPAMFGQKSGRPVKRDLPVAVHDVFVRTYPRATIKKWTQDSKDGKSWYDVESIDGTRSRHVLYTEDGSLLETRDLLTATEIPDAIRKAALDRYPQSKLLKTEKRLAGTTVRYWSQIRKKNRKHVELLTDESGTILK